MSDEAIVKKRGRPKKIIEPATIAILGDAVAASLIVETNSQTAASDTKSTTKTSRARSKTTESASVSATKKSTSSRVKREITAEDDQDVVKPKTTRPRRSAKIVVESSRTTDLLKKKSEAPVPEIEISIPVQAEAASQSPAVESAVSTVLSTSQESIQSSAKYQPSLVAAEAILSTSQATLQAVHEESQKLTDSIDRRVVFEHLVSQLDQLDHAVTESHVLIKNIQLRRAAERFAELEAQKQQRLIDQVVAEAAAKLEQSEEDTAEAIESQHEAKIIEAEPLPTTSIPSSLEQSVAIEQLPVVITQSPPMPLQPSQIQSQPQSRSDSKQTSIPIMSQTQPLPASPPQSSSLAQRTRSSPPTPPTSIPSTRPTQIPTSRPPPSRLPPPLPQSRRPTPATFSPPAPKPPTEQTLTELKKNPRFRGLLWSWTGIIVGVPVVIVTSLWLWEDHKKRHPEGFSLGPTRATRPPHPSQSQSA